MREFKDRINAGKELAKKLIKYKGKNVIVLAIPRGGVPVAFPVAKELKAKLDLVIPRKIPIPSEPEAGFGAVTIDGNIVINKPLVKKLNLTKEEITELSKPVIEEIKRRTKVYRGNKPFPNLRNKIVIIIDDGLATGYTAIAAVNYVKKYKPKEIIVAVPISSYSAFNKVKKIVDELVSLEISHELVFAVADSYESFPDLKDEEVIKYLKNLKN